MTKAKGRDYNILRGERESNTASEHFARAYGAGGCIAHNTRGHTRTDTEGHATERTHADTDTERATASRGHGTTKAHDQRRRHFVKVLNNYGRPTRRNAFALCKALCNRVFWRLSTTKQKRRDKFALLHFSLIAIFYRIITGGGSVFANLSRRKIAK